MKFKLFIIIVSYISITAQTSIFFKYNANINDSEIDKLNESILEQSLLLSKSTEYLEIKSFNGYYLNKNSILKSIFYIEGITLEHAEQIEELLSKYNIFEYVQIGNKYKIDYLPNDSLISSQWNLSKINAFGAWDISEGNEEIIIAVIDTGVDYLHPDLVGSIWVNSLEDINQNGRFDETDLNEIDNDNNGFVDDVIGWDFTNRTGFPFDSLGGDYLDWDNDPMDEHFHGTFVSGIVGASVNNEIGISGVVPKTKIMVLRAFDPNGTGDEDDVASAILYAVKMGAKIINMSFGDDKFSFVLKDVLQYAYDNNVILVASSGNSGSDQPHYPSGYDFVISVGNSNQNDIVSSTSNFGSTLDLTAPGSNIISTDLNSSYRTASGTSASAPHVSGAAALLLSIDSTLTNEQIKKILKSTSDDIESPGWDIKSGAGRLNIEKALQVPLKSEIKISHPSQDFSTAENFVDVDLTVISPYFKSYELSFGVGITPTEWIILSESSYQHKETNVAQIDISNFPDTSFTVCVLINQNNGITLEERVNFYKDTTPPQLYLGTIAPVYYGDKSTVLSEVYTDDRCIVKLFFSLSSFDTSYISLDGFNINNHFVKNYHYGFIPKEIVEQNSSYKLWIEAENLSGLKTIVNIDFPVLTHNRISERAYSIKNFSLPRGNLFNSTVGLTTDNQEILFQEFYSSDSIYYQIRKYENDLLVKHDSIDTRIPVALHKFGRENNFLVSKFLRSGIVDRQINSTYNFQLDYQNNTGKFYPVLVQDLNGNGVPEIITNNENEIYYIWKAKSNGELFSDNSLVDSLVNYSDNELNNVFGNQVYLNVIAADANGDGKTEIWTFDSDGDILLYDYSNGQVSFLDSLHSNLITFHGNTISKGDIDGDGVEEVAVLFKGNSIAPFFVLRIYNYLNNSFNLVHEKLFLDQSTEFTDPFFTKVYQTLSFSDIDNDNDSELIINIFPYFYIYDFNNDEMINIFYDEGINLESIYTGDVDRNGIIEIAIQNSSGIYFIEFGKDNQTPTPSISDAYCFNSFDNVIINVRGEGEMTYLYKGNSSSEMFKIDSAYGVQIQFIDNDIYQNNTFAYYAVQSYDSGKTIPLSKISVDKKVYIHTPANVVSAEAVSQSSIKLNFDAEMPITIFDYNNFYVIEHGIPNSISPESEYSYLLTYSKNFNEGTYELVINNLRDKYGSPIKSDTVNFFIDKATQVEEFFITNFKIIGSKEILIEFNLDVDQTSFSNTSNFVFNPMNEIETIEFPFEANTILLKTKNPVEAIGKNYSLLLKNVYSKNNIPITEEAGNSIVIQSFKEDINDVYVYPNPITSSNFSNGLTFANLTQYAEIYIFTLSGEFVTRISENNGDGGVTWNLRDEKGESISSGIYIYKVIATDSSGNEIAYKIDKFAVIK